MSSHSSAARGSGAPPGADEAGGPRRHSVGAGVRGVAPRGSRDDEIEPVVSGRSRRRHKQHQRKARQASSVAGSPEGHGWKGQASRSSLMDEALLLDHGPFCSERGGRVGGARSSLAVLDEAMEPYRAAFGHAAEAPRGSACLAGHCAALDDALGRDQDRARPPGRGDDLIVSSVDFSVDAQRAALGAEAAVRDAVESLGTLAERVGDVADPMDDGTAGTPATGASGQDEAEVLRRELELLKAAKLDEQSNLARAQSERDTLVIKLEAARNAVIKTVEYLDQVHRELGAVGAVREHIAAAPGRIAEIDGALAALRSQGAARPAAIATSASLSSPVGAAMEGLRDKGLASSATALPEAGPKAHGKLSLNDACWLLGALEYVRVQALGADREGGPPQAIGDDMRRAQRALVEDIRRWKQEEERGFESAGRSASGSSTASRSGLRSLLPLDPSVDSFASRAAR